MTSPWRVFLAGWACILVGSLAAHLTQTAGGTRVTDVRFETADGATLSALLYVPASASAANKAPGVLAVHGYINSREVQSGFAIEFARRGYVVLALDQTGHGYSAPPAFGNGFGGPAALQYLRSLDMVDTNNIGLEGHSMGGWTVLAAAAAYPDDYRAMVLEGSSTGAPFAADGTPQWPRNLSVVFSLFDEFAPLMWGTERAQDAASSAKMQALFATTRNIETDRLYGDINSGTARILQQPPVTHPGDHISHAAIGHALDWFATTLDGGTALNSDDQIWFRKEIGTLLALCGFVTLLIGSFRLLLQLPFFSALKQHPQTAAWERRTARWWVLAGTLAIVPVATFYLFFKWAEALLPPSAWLPQGITNQVVFWALANALLGFAVSRLGKAPGSNPASFATAGLLPSMILALLTVAIGYAAVVLADRLFLVDFRFWFVGVKMLSLQQFGMALVYLVPFTLYFVVTLRGLHGGLSVSTDQGLRAHIANALVLMGGFAAFLGIQYASLFGTGVLLTPGEPLNTIVMMQFVPLLLIVAVLSTSTFRATGSYLPGAFINALFVTWYIVAGQATQFAAAI